MCLSDEWIGLCAGCVGDSRDSCSPADAYPGLAAHADGHAGEVRTFCLFCSVYSSELEYVILV